MPDDLALEVARAQIRCARVPQHDVLAECVSVLGACLSYLALLWEGLAL